MRHAPRPPRGVAWTCWPALGATLLLGAGAPASVPPPPRRHVIEIRDMVFKPASVAVAPGDTVVWINRDLVPHTATAERAPAWDTGILAQNQSASLVAGGPGERTYRCVLHPLMRGTLLVRNPRTPSPEARSHET